MTRALRTLAIAIAAAAALDPSVTISRPVKPEIGLIPAAHLPDPALEARARAALSERFTVISGAPIGAAALVSIGYQLPPIARGQIGAGLGDAAAYGLVPEPRLPFVSIGSIEVAASVPLQSRATMRAVVHAWAAHGRTINVELRQDGVAIARAERRVEADDAVEEIPIEFVPASVGAASMEVVASIAGAPGALTAHAAPAAVAVHDRRLDVLTFDLRPSWMATFVRRALEADARFQVTSRTVTSRGAAAVAGAAPAALGSLSELAPYRLVIVGAPEELRDDQATTLDRYMREQGGAVVLLLDQPVAGRGALQRLTGVSEWSETIAAKNSGTPAATELVSPAPAPPWVRPYGDASGVWILPAGRGRLIVSGALDAWRFRADNEDAFDAFWRSLAASLAAGHDSASQRIRVAPDERALLELWTSARGGAVLPESRLDELVSRLFTQLAPVAQAREVHPMRSAWWIVPFAGALGAEWWRRRRSGLR
jgi:hypothetical protein